MTLSRVTSSRISCGRITRGGSLLIGVLAASAAFQEASAQFDVQWVSFIPEPDRIVSSVPLTTADTESDLAWGDLSNNGWTDVVVVRKQHFTTPGKRPNILLMNENGVLVNRTDDFATAVMGTPIPDFGFNTPTNDRDVVIADFNNDGWLDVATATTLSDGDRKHIGHPRIYMNLGEDAGGNWLGLRFENARFPQLFQFNTGLAENPRFNAVAAGDVTHNGVPDLYFGDHDSSSAGGAPQPPGKDLNDRLITNDGNGFFTDESQLRMTSQMLLSSFSSSVAIGDMNLNGFNDVVKQTALSFPQYVAASFNDPGNPGFFNEFDPFHLGFDAWYIAIGDLNNDGRLDIVMADDFRNRFRLNLGTDALGRVIWGPAALFDFLFGNDLGFASNTVIADLDGDGWNDVLIADVDTDVFGYNRRLFIYQSLAGLPVGSVVIREQRQSADDSGWIGVVGMFHTNMRGTHDIAVFDIDNDGDNDLLISRRDDNVVWINQTNPTFCQQDLGFGGPGQSLLAVCGQPLWFGNSATLSLTGAPASVPAFLVVSSNQSNLPLLGGTLVPFPILLQLQLQTDAAGNLSIPLTSPGPAPDLFMQMLVLDLAQPELVGFSNAVRTVWN